MNIWIVILILVCYCSSCTIKTSSEVIKCCRIHELKGKGEKDLEWYDNTAQRHIGSGERLFYAFSPGLHEIKLECGDGDSDYIFILAHPPKEELLDYVETLGECELEKKKTGLEWWLDRVDTVVTDLSQPKLALNNPTNINSISGFSGLTSGFSEDGDLTLLLYPGPGWSDHVEYETSGLNEKRRGANSNMGAFGGILCGNDLIFLRDFDDISQFYSNDESTNVVTKYTNNDWVVTQNDFITPPPNEVLIRSFSFELLSKTNGSVCYFIHYENLAPATYIMSLFPFADNALDFFNDFGVFHHSEADAIVHFRPNDQDWDTIFKFTVENDPLTKNITQEEIQDNVNKYVDSLDSEFGEGSYFAIGSLKQKSSLVYSSTVFAGIDPVIPLSPQTSFSPYRAGRSASASYYRLNLDQNRNGENDQVSVVISAGSNSSEAREGLGWARNFCRGSEVGDCVSKLMDSSDQYWKNELKDIILPNTKDKDELFLYKRGIIVNIQSQSSSVGSMVASVSVTPNYDADWIRDGSFLNLVLDMNGFHEKVTNHLYFWAEVQRESGLFEGTYDMNYFSDGQVAGPVELEIDQVGLGAWSMCLHSQFLPKDDPYLETIYPYLKKSVEFLYKWRDEKKGLPLPANVDDNIKLQVNLQGSLAVLLGLKAGLYCGRIVGEENSTMDNWEAYAKKLENSILSTFYDPEYQAWGFEAASFTGQGIRGASWFLWPAILVPLDSKEAIMQTKALRNVTSGFEKCLQGMYGYPTQSVIGVVNTYVKTNDTEGLKFVKDAIQKFVTLMSTKNTCHNGEWTSLVNTNPGCKEGGNLDVDCCETASGIEVNDMPHNWEHALVNLIMRKFYGPWPEEADCIAKMRLTED